MDSIRLFGQWAPSIFLFLICTDPCWGYRCVPSFYVGSNNPNLGFHSCASSTAPTETSSSSNYDIFTCKFKWSWICRPNIVFDFYLLIYLSLFLLFSETRSWYIAKIGLKLAVKPKLALNFQSSCLSRLSSGITDLLYGIWFWLSFQFWKKKTNNNKKTVARETIDRLKILLTS